MASFRNFIPRHAGARSLGTFGLTESIGLADLSRRFELPDKSGPYDEIDGKRFEGMPPELVERLRIGCDCDVLEPGRDFQAASTRVPEIRAGADRPETRMFTAPTIYGDVDKLRELVASERARKEDTAPRARRVTEAVFRSTGKFVALLESLGEKVATKNNAKLESRSRRPTPNQSVYMRHPDGAR